METEEPGSGAAAISAGTFPLRGPAEAGGTVHVIGGAPAPVWSFDLLPQGLAPKLVIGVHYRVAVSD